MQFVDPTVSRAKFLQQIEAFKDIQGDLNRRGWFLVEANFPCVFLIFASPKLKPPAIIFGALIDFSNYDFEPPSVKVVDPFSRAPYSTARLPSRLNRLVPSPNPAAGLELVPLLQGLPDQTPFFCIPGIKEYHDHPGHTGDSWFLHRKSAEGSLYFIAEQLAKYGVEPLAGYDVGLKVAINGFTQAGYPE